MTESASLCRFGLILLALCPLCCLRSVAAGGGDIFAKARSAKRGMIVYAYGSDWSESGRRVLKAFRDPAFVRAFSGRYVMGVTDDADNVTEEIRRANAWAARGDLGSVRLPALFASDREGRGFLVLENLPISTTAEDLVNRLKAAEAEHARAVDLLKAANRLKGVQAAESRGAAMEIFARGVGDSRVTGGKCLKSELERLRREDPEDRTGWQRRFTLGNCTALINAATALRELPNEAEEFLARERAKSTAHLTLNQKQAVGLLPYAIYRGDESKRAENVKLLDQVAAMGTDTLWGMAAVGFLIREKAPEAQKYQKPRPVREIYRSRGDANGAKASRSLAAGLEKDLAAIKGLSAENFPDALPERVRTGLVRAHILSSAGPEALLQICALEGGTEFLLRFLGDRAWMEEFAGSGPWPYGCESALRTLDMLLWNVPEAMDDPMLRRAATAFAINYKAFAHDEKSIETLRIYRDFAKAGRLHDRANGLDVYGWRHVSYPWESGAWVNDNPEDLRRLNAFANCSYRRTISLGWVPYRMHNCFGDHIHGPYYYQPWEHRDTRYDVSPEIGGVCGMISTFGTRLGQAHGFMAVPVYQPRHLAFLVRLGRSEKGTPGRWSIQNNISPFSGGNWSVFGTWGGLHNVLAGEALYGNSELPAREFPRWLAALKRRELKVDGKEPCRDEVVALYWRAMKNVPGHLHAALDWARYVDETAPKEVRRWEELGAAVVKTMPNTIPGNIEILKRVFGGMAAAGHPERRLKWAKRFLEGVREERSLESPDFNQVLNVLEQTFEPVPDELFEVYLKAVETQVESKDYFAQVLNRAMGRYPGDPAYEARFFSTVVAAMGGSDVKDVTPWRRLLSQLEDRDNPTAVVRLREVVAKHFPFPARRSGARSYPESGFGGKLVSDRSLVRLSAVHGSDRSERHGELTDDSPLRAEKAGAPAVALEKEGLLWIGLRLGGETEVTGVRLVGQKLPELLVETSGDGVSWAEIGTMTAKGGEARLDLSKKVRRIRFIRLRVVEPKAKASLALEKFLVYGRRLY